MFIPGSLVKQLKPQTDGTKLLWQWALRVALLAFLLYCALALPWYALFGAALLYVYWYPGYELIIIGVFLDALFSTTEAALWGSEFVYTSVAILLVACGLVIKKLLA